MFHQTNTLTTGTDTVTGTTIETITAGLDYTPGGNDRVNTLQSEDSITGGAGTSTTLNATIGNNNDNGSDVIAPTMTGVEIVNIRSTASDGAVDTLDFSSVSGVTAININQVLSDSFVVRNISEAASLSVSDLADDTASVAFEFTDAFVTGSSTTLTVTVDGFEGNQLNIGADANATTEGQNVEVLNLVASGDDSRIASLGSDDLTTLTLSGAADLTIAALTAGTSLLNVDASAMTGAATISLGAATENGRFTYSGSDGADTVTLTNGGDVIQASDSLSGGAGADTLVIRPATENDDVTSIGVSGTNASAASFETLTLRADDLGAANAVDFIVDLDHITGVTQINLITMETTTFNAFTLNDIGESTTGALTPVSVTLGGTALGDTDVTLDAADGAGNESIAMTVSVADDGHHVDIIDANANIETISVVVSGQFNAELDFSGDFAGDSSNDGSISISGHTAGRTLTVDDNAIVAETVNLTGLLSDASIVLGAADQTVTGGSGDDTFTFGTNLSNADVVNGGAGNDRVVIDPATSMTQAPTITNVEELEIGATATVSLVMTGVVIPEIVLQAQASQVSVVTLTNMAGITNISAAGVLTGTLNNVNGLTLAGTGYAGTADALTFSADASAIALTTGVMTLTGIEDLTIAVTGSSANADFTIGTGITGSSLNNIVVTSSGFGTSSTSTDIVLGNINDGGTDTVLSFTAAGANTGVSATLADMAAAATVTGSAFYDTISVAGSGTGVIVNGGAGNDTLTAATGATTLNGDAGDDTLIGGAGADFMNGGAGNDLIVLNGGADTVSGGAGVDTFRFATATTTAATPDVTGVIITDFTAGLGGDVIDLGDATGADAAIVADLIAFAGGTSESGLTISAGTNVSLTTGLTILTGANAASLSVADIVTRLNDMLGDSTTTTDDIVDLTANGDDALIAISDGTNVAIVHLEGDGSNVALDAADVTVIATLQNVTIADLTSANFADFI